MITLKVKPFTTALRRSSFFPLQRFPSHFSFAQSLAALGRSYIFILHTLNHSILIFPRPPFQSRNFCFPRLAQDYSWKTLPGALKPLTSYWSSICFSTFYCWWPSSRRICRPLSFPYNCSQSFEFGKLPIFGERFSRWTGRSGWPVWS